MMSPFSDRFTCNLGNAFQVQAAYKSTLTLFSIRVFIKINSTKSAVVSYSRHQRHAELD